VTNATLTSITVSPSSANVNAGSSLLFSATGHFSDGSTQNLINAGWSSSNPNVAIITTWGLATSSGAGTTTISATLNGVTGNAVLTVQ
jgi:Bacterial Ig-like domain (group 2)